MFNDFFKEANALENTTEAYAIAVVVRREVPTSGKPGDKAIIKKDGSISGWIGGGCTRGIILKEALAAIQEGKPRLVSIDKENPGQTKSGVVSYNMTCQSGGALEVYIEPVLPKPHLMIMGKSHIAMALARIGKTMGYRISLVLENVGTDGFEGVDQVLDFTTLTDEHFFENTCVVVSTQGEGDEMALEKALRGGNGYVAFVASRRKANAIFGTLRQQGFTFDDLKKIKTPAGLDIHAKLPEEVAISILAQIIEFVRKPNEESKSALNGEATKISMPEDYYINPVCKIPVQKSSAKHVIEYKDEKVYFCCDGCKVSFEKAPEQYMTTT